MLNFLTSRKFKLFIIFLTNRSFSNSQQLNCNFLQFKCKHLFARLATMMTSSLSLSFFNRSSRISNRWFSFIEWRKYVNKLLSTSDLVEETGFSPVLELNKGYSKTIHITLFCELACLEVFWVQVSKSSIN